MIWLLTTAAGEKVSLAAVQIVQSLMGKVQETEKSDVDVLTQTFAEYLEANNVVHKMRLIDAIHMGFSMGYFYRVFLEKNNVEIQGDEHESDPDAIQADNQ